MRMLLFFVLGLTFASPAAAADNVTLKSDVFVAREVKDAAGKTMTRLEPPKLVTPGDRLVFVLDYKNQGAAPATGFTVTNPVPAAVSYTDASTGAVVSADGGKSWGQLAALKVAGSDGQPRAATAADVTHIRWTLARAVPAGQGGKLQFRGVVK